MKGQHAIQVGFALAIVCSLALAAPAVLGQSSESEGPVDRIVWPPGGSADRENLSELADPVLDVARQLTVGESHAESVVVDRVNETTSSITVRAPSGDADSVEIEHEPVDEEARGSPLRVGMEPDGLVPTVQVSPSLDQQQGVPGLRVFGPPGSFDVAMQEGGDWKDFRDASERIGDQLGLPSEEDPRFDTDWRTAGGAGHPWPNEARATTSYLSSDGICDDEQTDDCYRFQLGCDNCTLTWGRIHPTPGEQLESASDGEVKVRSTAGWAHVLFDGNEPFYVAMDVGVDLNTSAFVPADDARDQVLANLSEQGLEPTDGFEVQETRLGLTWGVDGNRLEQATYDWSVNVEAENDSDEREAYGAAIQQDALSGEILEVDLRPSDISDGEPSGDGDEPAEQEPSPTDDASNGSEASGNGTEATDGGSDGPNRTPATGLASVLTFVVLVARGARRHC